MFKLKWFDADFQRGFIHIRPKQRLMLTGRLTRICSTASGIFPHCMTYSSNALEGNSLTETETETKIVLEDGITTGGKPVKDHLEVLGHWEARTSVPALQQEKNPW